MSPIWISLLLFGNFIEITLETSIILKRDSHISFLDTVIYKRERLKTTSVLDIKTYIKPTETFQYLERTSSHPQHVFKAFIKGEIIRYIRNTNCKTELLKQVEPFKRRLLDRNYSEIEINSIIHTNNLNRKDLLRKSNKIIDKQLVIVTKYNFWTV